MYDIIIVGGGISGAIAAIAASRKGSKTLLIERNGYLGGALTSMGVGPMMTFHAGDDLVIQGITNEVIERLQAKGKSPGHIVDTTGYTYTVTPFEAEALKYELETMITENGGEILYHTMLAQVESQEAKIQSITVCNKAGLTKYKAKCYIDATGDGDLSSWAGVPCHKGREADGVSQPMTLNIKMTGVDTDAIRAYMRENPDRFKKQLPLIEKSPRLSLGGFGGFVKDAIAKGDLLYNIKGSVLMFETDKKGEVIINSTRVIGCDATDPVSLSKAEMLGRREAIEFAAFLQKYIPGFMNASVSYTGPSIGVRSSRQIVGHYTLAAQDLVSSKTFEDTIAHSGYPIDIHSSDGAGCKTIKMEKGASYNIPYSCLTNPTIDNLITVGRCVSATFEAQAAIRVTPTAGAIGHAGGVAAWIYVQENKKATSEITIKKLQETLIDQKGYIRLN